MDTKSRSVKPALAFLAFVLGVMPLVFATGPGAAARHSMGTGVFGGMLAATFIATIFVPVFFTWFVRKNKSGRAAEPQVLIDNTKQGTETKLPRKPM